MKKKPTARLLIDASMAAAMLFSLAFRITGDFAHEWAGAAALVLFAAHIILNRRWFGGIPKGKYDFRRTLNTAANMALSVAATLVFATGLMSSKHLLGFWSFPEAWRCGKFIPPPPTGRLFWLQHILAFIGTR